MKKNLFNFSLIPVKLTLFACIAAFLSSCEKEIEVPSIKVTANAGIPIKEVNVGDNVELNAENSIISPEGTLTYLWEFIEKPENSEAEIENPTHAIAHFTPDEPGDYRIRLTVRFEELEDSAEITVTAHKEGPPKRISSHINENETWEKIAPEGETDYVISGDINLLAHLTIKEGVIIAFNENSSLRVLKDGILSASGTNENKIVFTGKEEIPGFWKGIFFNNTNSIDNQLDHVIVEYGGGAAFSTRHVPANIAIGGVYSNDNSNVSITNSIIRNSGENGLDILANSIIREFSNNEFSNNNATPVLLDADQVGSLDAQSTYSGSNSKDRIEIKGGAVKNNQTWPQFEDKTPLFVASTISVEADLTISKGTELIFAENQEFRVRGGNYKGTLTAEGTEEDKIIFTGLQKTEGFWKGIFFNNSQSFSNKLDYVVVEYGGRSTFANRHKAANLVIGGLYSNDVSRVSISNSTFSYSAGYGVHMGANASLNAFENNTFKNNVAAGISLDATQAHSMDSQSSFIGNNGLDVVEIDGGTMTSPGTWNALANEAYYFVIDDLLIRSNLTIEEGARFLMAEQVIINIQGGSHGGTFNAVGSPGNLIIFEGKTNMRGYWRGIFFNDSNSFSNKISYATIKNAGGFASPANRHEKANIMVGGRYSNDVSRVEISNCTISDSEGFGIDVAVNSTTTLSDNTYDNNALGNVNIQQ
jgi:hypothetical protein